MMDEDAQNASMVMRLSSEEKRKPATGHYAGRAFGKVVGLRRTLP
jgi:hypothetical protein